jgi:hypothetical protein
MRNDNQSIANGAASLDLLSTRLIVPHRPLHQLPHLDLEEAATFRLATSAKIAITTEEGKPRSQVAILIDIGNRHTLFHDAGGEAYAKYGSGAVCSVGSNEYKEILASSFYRLTGKGANRNALIDAINTLTSVAKFDGKTEPVFLRVGEFEGNIAIDSGQTDHSCFIVSKDGWSNKDAPPINFRRSGKPLSLPQPSKADFSRLWKYVNVRPADRVLVAAFMLAALRPRGPYPILILIGEQGSGKSRTARALKALTDPSASPLRSPPKDVSDLLVAAVSSRVLALDNLSGADPQLSDALCRLSTGGAMSGRTLYTNAEETLIEVQRPVILNGIDDLATRPDLAERSIILELPPIQHRTTEQELDVGFQDDAKAIFAALLDGLQLALRDSNRINIGPLPRMADFAKWAGAGVLALGFTSKEFIDAYRASQAGAIESGLDSSSVGQAVRRFMEFRSTWSGSASELLRELTQGTDINSRSWPRSPKGLLNALRRLGPSLRHAGIRWEQSRSAMSRDITLCKDAGQVSQAVCAEPPNDTCDTYDT